MRLALGRRAGTDASSAILTEDEEDSEREVPPDSRSWAGSSYPSPPPEERNLRGSTAPKRRHRQAGHGGSQKRSSTAGSVRSALSDPGRRQASAAREARLLEAELAAVADRARVRTEAARDAVSGAAFLGGVVARLTQADTETLELFADADGEELISTTPTQSRAGSPLSSSHRHRGLVAHGLHALSRYAQSELEDLYPAFHVTRDESEDDGDSGAETETGHGRWVKSYRPPTPALSDADADAELADSRGLVKMSSIRPPGSVQTLPGATEEGKSSPWGGEIERREAAFSYWRRLFMRMRGF